MIDIYLKPDGRKRERVDERALKAENLDRVLWIDIDSPTPKEEQIIKETVGVEIISKEEAREIESTSKYCEMEQGVVANINFYEPRDNDFKVEPISFILHGSNTLISIRHSECEVFNETARRVSVEKENKTSGQDIFMTLIEAHIDREADIMEMIAAQISDLSAAITRDDNIGKEVLKEISLLQSKIITFRENIFDLQRVLFSIRRSTRFSKTLQPRIQLVLQDIDSLINHADFSFQRLDSVQDTALGLINIEQNEIMKIFSIVAVIFMPPTLVASMYGMNFRYMPEIDWSYTTAAGTVIPLGYIFAIGLMLLLSGLMIWFCKFKKWI